jgi:hypothetical protein
LARWMLAHGNGLDELVVLAFGGSLALAVRLLVAHAAPPTTRRSPPVSEQRPDRTAADDDLPDPDESHGSDLDTRIGSGEDQAEQTPGADEAGP